MNDREVFDRLLQHESLRKLRVSFDFLLGHPLWWILFKLNGSPKGLKNSIESSYDIWRDSRVKRPYFHKKIYSVLRKRSKEVRPYLFKTSNRMTHFCVPLVSSGRVIGYLGLTDPKKGIRQEILNLLTNTVFLIVENCSNREELDRLSATIRPRAIALSTVHTVHRIINSTLNLNELISRLAHLTAQVLRAELCAIYLVVKPPSTVHSNALNGVRAKAKELLLVCKAFVGPSRMKVKAHRALARQSVEAKVARTAQIVLRKRFISIPLIDEDVIGVVTIANKKDKKGFTYFDQEILTTLAEEAVIAIKNAQLYEEPKKVTLGTIQSLAVILGTRVPNASSPEVFLKLALKMGEELKLGEEETQALHYATLLKDTAKIGIPDEILKKPTKLTGEEYRLLREHPIKGAKIVQSFESLKPVVPIILYSRERYDGTGYPKGLKGEKIPLGARILSVITAFEAIVMGRPYRDRSSVTEALAEIAKNSGTQFDPKVVEAFVRIVSKEDFYRILKRA